MINNTLLILGAGASSECGFPVGSKLIADIYEFAKGKTVGFKAVESRPGNKIILQDELENKKLIWRLLDVHGARKADKSRYGVEDIENFANALWDANPRSIDEFLHDREEFGEIGKICIFCCLSKYEDEKGLKPICTDKYIYPNLDWYRHLWHCLTDGVNGSPEEFKKNKLHIITFNYDRSLEEFLFRAIRAKFGLADWDAFKLLEDTIIIRHVYGDLGVTFEKFNYSSEETKKKDVTFIGDSPRPMPYQPFEPAVLFRLWGKPGEFGAIERDLTDLRFMRESDQVELAKTVIERAMRIKTYNENFENDLTAEFKETIKKAENIIFLGFAFHSQNLKVLGFRPNLISNATRISGTAYGLSNQELEEKKQVVRNFINLPENAPRVMSILNHWVGLDENKSIIKSFFKNVKGVRLD